MLPTQILLLPLPAWAWARHQTATAGQSRITHRLARLIIFFQDSGGAIMKRMLVAVDGSEYSLLPVKAFLLGSVSNRVVSHAPCSVLVVRPGLENNG
jgi:hypothetical protein